MSGPNQRILVCDKCLRASCWHWEFPCEEASSAGLIDKSRSELDALKLEHPDNYSDEKLAEVYA